MTHRNIRLFYLFNFFLDFRLFAAIQILYFTQVAGSFALGMSIFSIVTVSSALLELPTGILSDFVGRKKTIVLGSSMNIAAFVLYALGGHYWVLALGALFDGAAVAFFSGSNDAFLYETVKENGEEEKYPHYSGRASSMFQIALAIGSLLGGFAAIISFTLAMWLSVIPQIGCLIISLFMLEPKVHSNKETNIYTHLKDSLSQFKTNYALQLLSGVTIVRYAIGEANFLFRPAFIATLWPVWALGIARTGGHIVSFFGFYYSGSMLKRIGAYKVLAGEIILNRILNFVALLFPSVISPILLFFTSFFFGPGSIAIGNLMQKEFNDKQRATLGSINGFAGSIAFAIAAVGLGFIGDTFGVIPAILTGQVLLITPLFFYRKIFKHQEVL